MFLGKQKFCLVTVSHNTGAHKLVDHCVRPIQRPDKPLFVKKLTQSCYKTHTLRLKVRVIMLLRFRFENHLSIHQVQELSLVASSLKDRDDALIDCDAAPSGSLLPAMVLYGANASGKTNLVDAIQFMRNAVLCSHSRGDAQGGFPKQPFKLDPDAAAEATHCEVDFVLDDIRHHYGFMAGSDAIESEWLYYFPSAYRRRLFERNSDRFSFGRDLRG